MKRVKKAIIPAAGFGTRFLPFTKSLPKEMISIVDKPAIQLIVEEAVRSGIEEFLIIISRNKIAIENHFDRVPELEMILEIQGKHKELEKIKDIADLAKFYYVRQQEMRGLGDAILHARSFTGDEPFVVLLGDDVVDAKTPCLKQLIEVYNEYSTSVIGVQQVAKEDISKYGIVEGVDIKDRLKDVTKLMEKPNLVDTDSTTAVLGRYILTKDIYEELLNIKTPKNKELQLTDGLSRLLTKSKIYAYDFEGKRYDIGDKLGYLKATVEFALKNEEVKEPFEKYLKDIAKNNWSLN